MPFDPRRAKPGQAFGFTGRDGQQHELVADADGVVTPTTAEEVAILDSFDLPVARKAIAEVKAAETKKPADAAADGGQD